MEFFRGLINAFLLVAATFFTVFGVLILVGLTKHHWSVGILPIVVAGLCMWVVSDNVRIEEDEYDDIL